MPVAKCSDTLFQHTVTLFNFQLVVRIISISHISNLLYLHITSCVTKHVKRYIPTHNRSHVLHLCSIRYTLTYSPQFQESFLNSIFSVRAIPKIVHSLLEQTIAQPLSTIHKLLFFHVISFYLFLY